MSTCEVARDSRAALEPRPGATHTGKSYRGDIDGLRCVAVLLVVLFHILPPRYLAGGYVGVDIFFVISGYLITGILGRELAQGTFTFASFYERRVRRIMPALFVLLAATTVLGARVLTPVDFIPYARSLVAAVLSYSNLYFWTQDSYFNVTRVKLLEHTWSLSVEEQFYLLFPAALLLAWRRGWRLAPTIAVFGGISFAVSAYMAYRMPQAAFFMPYSRAWELMIGALLAITSYRPRLRPAARLALAAAGLVMIVLAVEFYSKRTPFPGAAALAPCCGAALLLWTGEEGGTAVSRLLAWSPLRFIGKISYSLYLWHWPLLLAARAGGLPGISGRGMQSTLLLLVLSIACAYLSWRWVEQPFRSKSVRFTRPRLFVAAGAAAATLCCAGVLIVTAHGFPGRYSERALSLATYVDLPQQAQIGTCFITSGWTFAQFQPQKCLAPVPGKKNYLVFGDSHAAYLWYGLKSAYPEVNFMQATTSGCPPALGTWDNTDCGKLRHFIFDYYEHYDRHTASEATGHATVEPLAGVILTSRWGPKPGDPGIDALEGTVKWFQQRHVPVILVGPVQEYDLDLPLVLAQEAESKDDGIAARHQKEGFGELDQRSKARASEWGVPYASLWQTQCGSGTCRVFADDLQTMPMMTDTDHLSNPGAVLLLKRLRTSGELLF